MASKIVEFFGFDPRDQSQAAASVRADRSCPFSGGVCVKQLRDGERSGVCTLAGAGGSSVICCPIRLYAEKHRVLEDVAELAFGPHAELRNGSAALDKPALPGKFIVAVFGKTMGGELRLPNRARKGGYYVDWILAKLTAEGDLDQFVAIEVQSIDTTGNYREERESHLHGIPFNGRTSAGLNWENVNKRILPQLIYKGQVLHREPQCTKGMFFVCPTAVLIKIFERLGGTPPNYPVQNGSITFLGYDIGPIQPFGALRALVKTEQITTSVGQVANAFNALGDLPEENVYANAIRAALRR